MKIGWIAIGWLALTLPALAAPTESRRIVVTGRAIGETPAAAEEARLDALREAVQQVCGSFINAQSETEDFALVRDKILEQPVGFARVVRVLKGPQAANGITEVQLEAEVFPVAFEKRWAEFAHIKQREGNPRCVIAILEDENPDDGIPPTTNGLVQTELERFFLEQKVQLMDKGATDLVRQRDLRLAAESGDPKKAAAAGAAFKADVVVLGRAEVQRGDSVNLDGVEVKRWNVTLTVRAVQTDSGAILVSKTYRPKRPYTTTSGSAKDALSVLGRDAAAEVLHDIGQAWRARATEGRTIQLMLSPCSRRQFRAIQEAMITLKGVTGGRDGFVLRELAENVATIDVNWKYDLEQLADRLDELSLETDAGLLTIDVVEQSANRIAGRVNVQPLPQESPPAPAEDEAAPAPTTATSP